MASVVFQTPFSFSQTGKYFSYCGNDGKLKIWDTSTGVLKQEYTKNLHLSSPCSCLIWLQTSKTKSTKKRKLNASNQSITDIQDVIALGTSNGPVLLYNVGSNSVVSELTGHNDRVTDLSSSDSGLYTCSEDKFIIQWDLTKHKVKSKWKAGKESLKAILALSCGEKLVTASSSIQLWNIETKELLKTYVGHSSPVFSLLQILGNDNYFVSAARGDRSISAWSVSAMEEPGSAVATFLLQDNVASLSVAGKAENAKLFAISESGVLHVFGHKLNGSTGKPLKPKLNVSIASEADGSKHGNELLPIHAALCLEDGNILLVYGNPAFFTFETLVPSELKEEHTVLVRQSKRRLVPEDFNSRTRVPEVSGNVEYTKGGFSARRLKEAPLEKRLENLALVSGSGSDAPKKDNLAQLLLQGLQSRDKDLIQDVLFRREDTIISTTVKNLPIQALLPLLRELTILLQGKTFTSRVAVKWLTAVVRSHAAILLSNPELKVLMAPLAAVIESKVDSLGGLLRLRGRLSLVAEQMTCSSNDDLDEPLVTYQERDDSSDSEPPLESDEAEAEEWDEFSDMDEDGGPE